MNKNVIILFLVLVLLIGGAWYYRVSKKKREEIERQNLGGMTGKEFLAKINPMWKTAWYDGYKSWLREQPEYSSINAIMQKYGFKTSAEANEWRNNEIQKASDGLWSLNPNPYNSKDAPNGADWGYKYWLPTVLNSWGIDMQNPTVIEWLKKIGN